jgi:hypothetical protein
MLKQEIAFIKALLTMDFSSALFMELRNALAARGKKKKKRPSVQSLRPDPQQPLRRVLLNPQKTGSCEY